LLINLRNQDRTFEQRCWRYAGGRKIEPFPLSKHTKKTLVVIIVKKGNQNKRVSIIDIENRVALYRIA
jgi:hypothetical protein